METTTQRPPDACAEVATPGGLLSSSSEPSQPRTREPFTIETDAPISIQTEAPSPIQTEAPITSETEAPIPIETEAQTLGSLPTGARLILRCRKDWRTATIAAFESELGRVVLNVASPSGHTYRVRRPADSTLAHDGHVPLLGEGCWRAGLARYDVRW